MAEETWHQARLIPTSGISGAEEQERRATSALLAVMSAVKEFSKSLLQQLGAPSGNVETYIEVPFLLGGKKCFPDGLIRVVRGSTPAHSCANRDLVDGGEGRTSQADDHATEGDDEASHSPNVVVGWASNGHH